MSYRLYKVDTSNLNQYCTTKSDAAKGIYRRPPDKFLVSDLEFIKGLLSDYRNIKEVEI
jgi:hypothetical protein